MASILRAAKYNFKGYSTVQAKACDATSNNTQPPTGGQMNELAQLSYNPDDFTEIITVLDKRLDAKGRNWRHVYKSLIVLDYLLHSGSETVIAYYQKNLYVIRTLKEFQYVDEEGKDHGSNVRIKAKDIATLLADESRLREIRRTRAEMRDRMLGRTASTLSSPVDEDLENENVQRRSALVESSDDDSLRLQSAMAQIRQARAAEDRDLLNAMRLSQAFTSDVKVTPPAQETAPKVESPPAPAAAPIPSTSSQEPDFSMLGASQVSQQLQQPQPSTNDPNLLVVFDGMDQLTAQPAPQFSSYNPFQVQQNLLQQQQDWLQMQAAQQMQQQQELWLHQQYLQQQQQELQQQMQQHAYHKAQFEQPIQPQPTVVYKSNNPFAPTTSPTPSLSSASSSPSIPSPKTPSSPPPPFASSTFSPSDQVSGFTTNPITRKSTNPFPAIDTQHLDNLFATRDDNGMDTFGNFGQLRYGQTFGQIQPAQTAL